MVINYMRKSVLVFSVLFFLFLSGTNALADGTCNDSPGPGGDNPDESFAVDAGNPPAEPAFISDSNTLVIKAGFYKNFLLLMDHVKSGYVTADSNTSVDDLLNASKLIIIPSGGLSGMENSDFFKSELEAYVKQGGTLIAFSQQHGADFSALPVPQEPDGTYKQVGGFGWSEDQSCYANSVNIENYHQIFSGQSRNNPSVNVDGYFTTYPSAATVLLRRVSNGQPAMLMYNYGLGTVIVTSMYSDYAYGHSQASPEEVALVRDMIAWAKAPTQLSEIHPGGSVSITLSMNNFSLTNAASAQFLIYSPDRSKLLSTQTANVAIVNGGSASATVNYQSASTDPLGIYHIDYALLDSGGNIIQPASETDSGRFAVSNPPSNLFKTPDFNFATNSDSESYARGSDATFTVTLYNHTASQRTITAKSFFPHDYWTTYDPQYGGDWSHPSLQLTDSITIAPNASTSFIRTIPIHSYSTADTMWSYFYDENGTQVGQAQRFFSILQPSAKINIAADRKYYAKGDAVNISINLKNNIAASYPGTVHLTVHDPNNNTVYDSVLNELLVSNANSIQSSTFIMNANSPIGTYTVSAQLFDPSNRELGNSAANFELPQSRISVTASLPEYLDSDSAKISFTLVNNGEIPVNSGNLNVWLKDPDGILIYNGSQPFQVAIGSNSVLSFQATIPALKFGNYTLSYSESDETTTGSPASINLPNSSDIQNFAMDKPSYKVRDTANLGYSILNNGKFNLNGMSVSITVPDAGFSNSQTIDLPGGNSANYSEAIPLPASMTAGQHDLNLVLTLPSGSSIVRTLKITIPESSLQLNIKNATVNAGDNLILDLIDNGGVDTNYAIQNITLNDVTGTVIYNGSASGSILAAQEKELIITQLPPQIASGTLFLNAVIKDVNTGNSYAYQNLFAVNGLSAILKTSPGKSVYSVNEDARVSSTLNIGDANLENASLDVKIGSFAEPSFLSFLPQNGSGIQLSNPSGIALGPDGSIYIADTNNYRILKYNQAGNFILSWGKEDPFGWWNSTTFYNPTRLALGPDGSVYVIDSMVIKKFDSNGNFITKWTGSCLDGAYPDLKDIAVGPDGYVYVVIGSDNSVCKYDSTGKPVFQFGSTGFGNGQFYWPRTINISSDGSIYVSDLGHGLQKFDPNGNYLKTYFVCTESSGVQLGIGGYDSVSFAPDGTIYDANNQMIIRFDDRGNCLQTWGYSAGGGQFGNLSDIETDSNGSVYVVDSLKNNVQKLDLAHSGYSFETITPLTQAADSTQTYWTDTGILSSPGKYNINAVVKNDLGQTISTAPESEFYVVSSTVALSFNIDKKIYKPNETVVVSGQVQNLSSATASGLSLVISQSGQNLFTAQTDIAAGGTYPFTFKTIAGQAGSYTLSGAVTQNGSTLAQIYDQYQTANPQVTASLSVPDTTGNDPFSINLTLQNTGKIDSTVNLQSSIDNGTQTITIPAGQNQTVQYTGQINADTTYQFTLTGDLNQKLSKTVKYGLGASVSLGAQQIYPEGSVSVPLTLTNTGALDENLSLNISLLPGNLTQVKTYFIPAGTSVTDSFNYSLTSGDYTLSVSGQNPPVSTQALFSVRKQNDIQMTVSQPQQAGNIITYSVNLINNGYNAVGGSLRYTVIDSQGSIYFSGEQTIAQIPSQAPQSISVPVDISALNPGGYLLKTELLDNANNQLAVQSMPLSVTAATFVLTQTPSYQTFYPGQQAQLAFIVKNTGNLEGAASLSVKAYDLADSSQNAWLQPGEEKTFTVNFMPPMDLSEGDYYADYTLTDASGKTISSGQVKYHLAGLALNVNASFDKQSYNVGDIAHLTLNIESQAATGQSLFARVNYAGYESQQSFTLNGSQTLTFDVPISSITGEKLFYGIYFDTGRSIYLNSAYIYNASDELLITTDKQVYNPGDTVNFTVETQNGIGGSLTVTAPGYSQKVAESGTYSGSFTLPSAMSAGTYNISVQMTPDLGGSYSSTHPFDVAGIKVKVISCSNDKGKYASSDTINTSYTINSNSNIQALIKTGIIDPDGVYTRIKEDTLNLSSTEDTLFIGQYPFTTSKAGIHRLVYGIYSGGLLLASGSQAFDVGDAVLLGVSTDKTDYPTSAEPVTVNLNMIGSVDANLELQLDGSTVKTSQISLNGVRSEEITLGTVSPGNHVLKAILKAGGLASTKETSFAYGSDLPDLVINGNQTSVSVDGNNMGVFRYFVVNQGRTSSTGTTAELYFGGTLMATNAVSALAPGASQEVDFSINVLGKAGAQDVKAIVDPDNTVVEFNDNNNSYENTIVVPDATIFTSTSESQYVMGLSGDIGSRITNLSANILSSYSLRSVVTSSDTGAIILDQTTPLNSLPAIAPASLVNYWEIPQDITEGTFDINQYVLKPDGEVAASSNTVPIQIIKSDFQVAFSPQSVSMKQGEKATYSGVIDPIGIFNSPVSLSVDGLPLHISSIFNPDSLVPPGNFEFDVMANDQTEAGTYPLTVTAEGGNRVHQYPLSLDVSAFSITADNTSANLMQLGSAEFNLSVNSLNGYSGQVSINVTGAPVGTKVSLDQSIIQAPGSAKLTLYTSKYARPGKYELTVTADDGLVKHTIKLDFTLELNPDIAFGLITAEGPGPDNPAWVRVLNSSFASKLELNAFSSEYGANVVSADIDGDGYDEIVVAQGPGPDNSASIRAYKRDGTLMGEWTIAEAKYGLTLAAGDLDGDWKDEIVVGLGPDPKNPASLEVLKYQNGCFIAIAAQTVYTNLKYGVNVAVEDVDGDGIPEIITAPGPGPNNPALITVWKLNGTALNEISSFTAFSGDYGANIAAGDVDGDGKAEIIVGNGPDPKNSPDVRVFKADGTPVAEFAPYDSTFGYGAYVAAVDLDEDGLAEIVTGLGPGPQNPALVNVFKNGLQVSQFLAYPQGNGYGVKVYLGRPGE